ncbi:hypothetical protein Acr_11g0009340 [Actinidia rufa]|uniref:Uncharacterized protein n=1 Tax=Actinidia rufa TaxID=165716 RepID=A0A7J0FDA4_9ERIC|nr:hypothetical protein Acr_11g0009340 [Actinidia rufa]
MELSRPQLLVHNDAVMNKFRSDHGIPNDILIEKPGPNEDANSDAEGGCGSVPAHLYASVCQFRQDHTRGGHTDAKGRAVVQRLGPVACIQCGTPTERACHQLVHRKSLSPAPEPQPIPNEAGFNNHLYTFVELMYCISVDMLQGSTTYSREGCWQLISIEVSDLIYRSTEVPQNFDVLGKRGSGSGSKRGSNQGKVPVPVLVVVAPILPAVGDEVEHSFIKGGGAESISKEEDMALNPGNLGTAITSNKSKAEVSTPEAQDPPPVQDPILALPEPTKVVLFLQYAADLAVEDSVEACDLMVMQHVQARISKSPNRSGQLGAQEEHSFKLKKPRKRACTLEGDLKKAKEALVAEVKACEANNDLAAKSLIEITSMDCGSIRSSSPRSLLSLSDPDSPMILSCFNEEDYMNRLAKERAKGVAEIGDAGNELEAEVGVEGARGGDQGIPQIDLQAHCSNSLPMPSANICFSTLPFALNTPELGTQDISRSWLSKFGEIASSFYFRTSQAHTLSRSAINHVALGPQVCA